MIETLLKGPANFQMPENFNPKKKEIKKMSLEEEDTFKK